MRFPRAAIGQAFAALGALLLAGCAADDVQLVQPIPTIAAPLVLPFADNHDWILIEPMVYRIGPGGPLITVPAGFVTDFASVPKRLFFVMSPHGRYSRATVIHDYLYWTQLCTQAESDRILSIAMTENGVPPKQIRAIDDLLYFVGAKAFATNAAARAAGMTRFVPEARRHALADRYSWADARDILLAELRAAGGKVAEPPVGYDASACAAGDPPPAAAPVSRRAP